MMENKHIVVSIHGIMTGAKETNDWEQDYGSWLAENEPSITYVKFRYGWLGPVRAWLSTILDTMKLPDLINNMSTSKFKKFLLKVQKDNPEANIHIVAHSYGTWVTWETLMQNSGIKIKSVAFVAGVISSHVEKNGLNILLQSGQIRSVSAWCSHNDEVVKPIALPPFGHLGYWGFLRKEYEAVDKIAPKYQPYPYLQLINRFTNFNHNEYFVPETFVKITSDQKYANNL